MFSVLPLSLLHLLHGFTWKVIELIQHISEMPMKYLKHKYEFDGNRQGLAEARKRCSGLVGNWGWFGGDGSALKVHFRRWRGSLIGTTHQNDIRHLSAPSLTLYWAALHLAEHAVVCTKTHQNYIPSLFLPKTFAAYICLTVCRGNLGSGNAQPGVSS